jgi:hypothetical protein
MELDLNSDEFYTGQVIEMCTEHQQPIQCSECTTLKIPRTEQMPSVPNIRFVTSSAGDGMLKPLTKFTSWVATWKLLTALDECLGL